MGRKASFPKTFYLLLAAALVLSHCGKNDGDKGSGDTATKAQVAPPSAWDGASDWQNSPWEVIDE